MLNVNAFPEVSIILPTYNRAAYILETIDSVQRQTYPNWELLIVDDGSKDNTIELISKIKDERIQLHKTSSRLGITGTRNEGMRKVKGELIAFIDSDDLWNPGKLEKQVMALNRYPEAGFCLTGGYNFRKLNEPLEFFYKQTCGLKYDDLFIPFFKSEVAATTPSLMFRKHWLDVIGFFNEAKSFADVDFILRLAGHSKGVILYESLFYRRLHDSNVSSLEWEKGCEEGMQLIRAYSNLLHPKIRRDILFRYYINSGEKYLSHRQKWKAIRRFFNAWKNKPFSIVPLKKTAKTILYSLKK
jgi:glycosyltransferase involved in cell wall biosynthesis